MLHNNNKTTIFTTNKKDMTDLEKMIENHKLLKEEVFEQLNELSKLDLSKFGEKEKQEIELSIYELELELSLRNAMLSDLRSLL